MTYEEKAKWIGRVFLLCLIAAIIAIVFAPASGKSSARKNAGANSPQDAPPQKIEVVQLDQPGSLKPDQIAELLAKAAKNRGGPVLGIVHCHVPGNPESEQLADILNLVAAKYGSQVLVIRVNIIACPEFAKSEQVTKPPEVLMLVGTVRTFRFQGLWPRPQIERKVDELLHGLRRVGKGWLPEVRGMQPATGAAPARP